MTIYEIKRRTQESAPFFFARSTLQFFGQRLKDFRVKKMKDGRYLVTAPMKHRGRFVGTTIRIFNQATNELETTDEFKKEVASWK